MAEQAGDTIKSYADYTARFIKMNSVAAQCVVKESSGSMKYRNTISSTSTKLVRSIKGHKDKISDSVAGAAITYDMANKAMLKIRKDLALSLQNKITSVVRNTIKVFLKVEDLNNIVSVQTTKALVENIASSHKLVRDNNETKIQAYKLSMFENFNKILSRSGKGQLAEYAQRSNRDAIVKRIWNGQANNLDMAPTPLFKITASTGNNIDLLAAYLTILNRNNLERVVKGGF